MKTGRIGMAKLRSIATRSSFEHFHHGESASQLSRIQVRTGLTLLELMVVLVILAIVSTVALQALQPQVEAQRFDSATRLLEEIQRASIGPAQKFQADGSPLVSGFVSDVGRLPLQGIATTSASSSTETSGAEAFDSGGVLSELWDVDSNLAVQFPYQFRPGPNQPIDYSSVRLPCGWRGPYLQLAIGATSIKDPWGKAPLIVASPSGQAETVEIELPPSANELAPQKLAVDLKSGTTEVTGKVLVNNPENTSIRVALLFPAPESSLTTLAVKDDEDPGAESFLFRDVPVGLRGVVCDVNGRRQTKYIQVSHTGATVVFDFLEREPAATSTSGAASEDEN